MDYMSDQEIAPASIMTFPLLDLPLELLEQIISLAHSSSLIKLGMCSHSFKEMTDSSWYWRNRIQNEKQKIICVDSKIDDWKRIFFSAVEFATIQQATDHSRNCWKQSKDDRCKIIFSPGTYLFQEGLRLRPNVDICGLWDTPWAQKSANQKTVFICNNDKLLRYLYQTNAPDDRIEIQNISFISGKKDSSGNSCCLLLNANYKVENCEFTSESRSALHIENSHVLVENCRFHDSKIGLNTLFNSVAHVRGSVFERNESGFRVSECHDGDSTIKDSTFTENRVGITIRKSTVQLSIVGCVVERSTDRGIDVRNNCECLVLESRISNNLYGLEVMENSEITIYKNVVTSNINSGIRIRHDVHIQRLAENEIKDNGIVGLSMAEYNKDKLFTREELLSNNTISDNKTDLVLLPKRPTYEMLYRKGDDEDTLVINCRNCIARNMCTFAGTEVNHVVQEWYRCYTCGFTDHGGVCIVCVKKCHDGHDVSFAPKSSGFYCDCGAGSNCKAMKVVEESPK